MLLTAAGSERVAMCTSLVSSTFTGTLFIVFRLLSQFVSVIVHNVVFELSSQTSALNKEDVERNDKRSIEESSSSRLGGALFDVYSF